MLGLLLNPFLSRSLGLVFWAWAPIILNPIKDQNVVFGSSFLSNPVFERKIGEKGEKRLGFGKDQVLGEVSSHFLLLCDQAT